jgi:hypothetical protein
VVGRQDPKSASDKKTTLAIIVLLTREGDVHVRTKVSKSTQGNVMIGIPYIVTPTRAL